MREVGIFISIVSNSRRFLDLDWLTKSLQSGSRVVRIWVSSAFLLLPTSQLTRNQPVDSHGGVVELLILGVAVTQFHFRYQPAVVADFSQRGSNGEPVVIA